MELVLRTIFIFLVIIQNFQRNIFKMDKLTFLSYEEARQSGEFNMIMDAHLVMQEFGIAKEDYWYIIKHYEQLAKKYL